MWTAASYPCHFSSGRNRWREALAPRAFYILSPRDLLDPFLLYNCRTHSLRPMSHHTWKGEVSTSVCCRLAREQFLYFHRYPAGLKPVVTHSSLAWERVLVSSPIALLGMGEGRELRVLLLLRSLGENRDFYKPAMSGFLPSSPRWYHCWVTAFLLLLAMLPPSRFFLFHVHVNVIHSARPTS